MSNRLSFPLFVWGLFALTRIVHSERERKGGRTFGLEAKAKRKRRQKSERERARVFSDATMMTKNEARTEKGVHSLSLEFRVLCSLSLSLSLTKLSICVYLSILISVCLSLSLFRTRMSAVASSFTVSSSF